MSKRKSSSDKAVPGLVLKDPKSIAAYAGKVVAIVDGEIKAAGTWDEVLAASARLVSPLFFVVPDAVIIGGALPE